jgi:hypothetical protein
MKSKLSGVSGSVSCSSRVLSPASHKAKIRPRYDKIAYRSGTHNTGSAGLVMYLILSSIPLNPIVAIDDFSVSRTNHKLRLMRDFMWERLCMRHNRIKSSCDLSAMRSKQVLLSIKMPSVI